MDQSVLFNHQMVYDRNTNFAKMATTGTQGTETVYEMTFNEKNLKEVFDLK